MSGMTPSELEYKLKSLPPNTPITAEHIIAILSALQAPQVTSSQEGAYSTWDRDKLIAPETLAEWIGEIPSRLAKWRVDGFGPQFVKGRKGILYNVGDVRDWIKSRTVQSTTQADRLSFVTGYDDCYVEPIIYHDEQPYSLFESIELLGRDEETNITGFEVLITADPVAMGYLNGNYDLLKDESLNELHAYYVNGTAHQGTVAHLVARYPATDLKEWLPDWLRSGMDFTAKDGEGLSATEYGNDSLNDYIAKWNMKERFDSKFALKGDSKSSDGKI